MKIYVFYPKLVISLSYNISLNAFNIYVHIDIVLIYNILDSLENLNFTLKNQNIKFEKSQSLKLIIQVEQNQKFRFEFVLLLLLNG